MPDIDIAHNLADVVADYNKTSLGIDWPFHDHEFDSHVLLCRLGLERVKMPDATIFDIGTGRGIFPRFFARIGARAITMDWPCTGGNEALRGAALAGVETFEGDASSDTLPLESNSVDCVYLADVIEHLPHSPKFMLGEIRRVLKEGGVCITVTPNAVRLITRIKMMMGYSNWPRVADYYELPFHGGHHHEYTASELEDVFTRAGFREMQLKRIELSTLHAPLNKISDLHSGHRSPQSGGRKKYWLSRRCAYFLTQAFPSLRGILILSATK